MTITQKALKALSNHELKVEAAKRRLVERKMWEMFRSVPDYTDGYTATLDGHRFRLYYTKGNIWQGGWKYFFHLIRPCPRCGRDEESVDIHNLVELGGVLTEWRGAFYPHQHNCPGPVRQQITSPPNLTVCDPNADRARLREMKQMLEENPNLQYHTNFLIELQETSARVPNFFPHFP